MFERIVFCNSPSGRNNSYKKHLKKMHFLYTLTPPNDIEELLDTLPLWCHAARTQLVFLSPAPHHARWLNYEVAAVSGPANGNLNAGREGKWKGSKFLSAGEMESDRSLARAVPLRGATAVIHLASPPPSHPTLPCLSNLPGTPPPRLSSLSPARPPSSSATVAALRSFSMISV